jgi:hypothetical protein
LADDEEFEQAERDLETNHAEIDSGLKQDIKPLTFADVLFF